MLAALEEVSDGKRSVDVETSGIEGDPSLGVVEGVSVAVLSDVDVVISTGVDLEETNGGAFSMYEPLGCTA